MPPSRARGSTSWSPVTCRPVTVFAWRSTIELSLEEWRAGLAAPMSEEEEAEILSLIGWFCRRYPTPAERLAYARRAYRRWTRAQQSGVS